MSKRSLFAFLLVAMAGVSSVVQSAGPGPVGVNPGPIGVNPGINIDLKQQLQMGLKARRPVEFQYINELIAMIEAGTMPRSLVDSTFVWARHKKTRQLQYFQFALKTRGDKLGVVTPSLKDQFVDPITGTLPPNP